MYSSHQYYYGLNSDCHSYVANPTPWYYYYLAATSRVKAPAMSKSPHEARQFDRYELRVEVSVYERLP